MRTWYACELAEKPTDAYVLWHYKGCRGCEIRARALARMYPDDPRVRWLSDWVVA